MLNDLWPADIQAEEVLSPMEILESQANHLAQRTNGLLNATVECDDTEDRRVLGFEVYASILDTRVRLFEVHQSLELEYPVAIVLPNQSLPEFLKPERYVPPQPDLINIMRTMTHPTGGKWVKNEWVATSPQEFSEKIAEALDHPSIKGRVLSLIARSQVAMRQKKADQQQTGNGDENSANDDNA